MKTIELTQGKIALVDDADFDRVNALKWHVSKRGMQFYATRHVRTLDGKRWTKQYLHQFLLPGVEEIDHKDGNGLINCKYNLRPATHQQNTQGFRQKSEGSTSQFRGVCWNKPRQKWKAQIKINGKHINIGRFSSEQDAARAYDVAARKYFGEFASPNFPI